MQNQSGPCQIYSVRVNRGCNVLLRYLNKSENVFILIALFDINKE